MAIRNGYSLFKEWLMRKYYYNKRSISNKNRNDKKVKGATK